MSRITILSVAVSGAILAALGPPAVRAADTVIDFEDYAVGTAITTQYAGVTISAPPNSCGEIPGIQAVISTASGGTSSGTRALRTETGCPDFSPDYLRLVFDEGHAHISFTLGNSPGTYAVRAYTTTAGGSPVITQNVVLTGSSYVGVFRVVHIDRSSADIRRVEIQDTIDDFEFIDDLTFDCPDATPPTAAISSPEPLMCVCSGVSIVGTAADADGAIAAWRLERRAVDAAVWTLIALGSSAVNNAQLSLWFPAGSATEGYYLLRLTVTNQCGLISTAETVVYLNRQLDVLSEASIRAPANGDVLGGTITVDGSVWDHCGGTFTVEKRALGGMFGPVTTLNPPWIINDPLATWNTRAGVVDGNYELRVSGTDQCGATASVTRAIVVDNTLPTAVLNAPPACAYTDGVIPIIGTAADAHLAGWELHYTHHNTAWLPLASGAGPVFNGVFLNWSVSALPRCAYTLRLRVTDTAIVDGLASNHNVAESFVSFNIGALGDMNCDGRTDNFDIDPFVECIINGDCYCP